MRMSHDGDETAEAIAAVERVLELFGWELKLTTHSDRYYLHRDHRNHFIWRTDGTADWGHQVGRRPTKGSSARGVHVPAAHCPEKRAVTRDPAHPADVLPGPPHEALLRHLAAFHHRRVTGI